MNPSDGHRQSSPFEGFGEGPRSLQTANVQGLSTSVGHLGVSASASCTSASGGARSAANLTLTTSPTSLPVPVDDAFRAGSTGRMLSSPCLGVVRHGGGPISPHPEQRGWPPHHHHHHPALHGGGHASASVSMHELRHPPPAPPHSPRSPLLRSSDPSLSGTVVVSGGSSSSSSSSSLWGIKPDVSSPLSSPVSPRTLGQSIRRGVRKARRGLGWSEHYYDPHPHHAPLQGGGMMLRMARRRYAVALACFLVVITATCFASVSCLISLDSLETAGAFQHRGGGGIMIVQEGPGEGPLAAAAAAAAMPRPSPCVPAVAPVRPLDYYFLHDDEESLAGSGRGSSATDASMAASSPRSVGARSSAANADDGPPPPQTTKRPTRASASRTDESSLRIAGGHDRNSTTTTREFVPGGIIMPAVPASEIPESADAGAFKYNHAGCDAYLEGSMIYTARFRSARLACRPRNPLASSLRSLSAYVSDTPGIPPPLTDHSAEPGPDTAIDSLLRIRGDLESVNGTSSVACETMDPSLPETFCDARDLAIRIDRLPVVDPQGTYAKLDFFPPPDTLRGSCILDQDAMARRRFGWGAAYWLYAGLKESSEETIRCDAWIDSGVFFVSRYDSKNAFHIHQDLMNTFQVYAALGLDVTRTQVVLLDNRSPDGPYADAWGTVFSGTRKTMDIRQIAARVANLTGKGDATLCLRRGVFGIHGGVSPMSREGYAKNKCTHSRLYKAFSRFVLDRVGTMQDSSKTASGGDGGGGGTVSSRDVDAKEELSHPGRDAEEGMSCADQDAARMKRRVAERKRRREADNQVVRITYARRMPSPDSGSVEPKTAQRHLDNEDDLIAHLRSQFRHDDPAAVSESASGGDEPPHETFMSALARQHGPAVRIEMRAVEFGKLPFHAQIALAGETDILVGMHGAALVHSLYLARRPRGMLIELKPASRRTGNYQFHNLAGTQGHDYVEYDAMRRVDDRDMNAIADFVREGVVRILGARRAGNETRP